ncbi:restriction endonuclease subunit S [Streptomyces sp. AC602_WCS936]|uniref:restriction endonuclease subunit S n=1 Tax=Streptomyces sp. AC602_WCS936 TaxID=2823685 RepID=UPI001C25FAA4|nr:restriction endonuclease subunit S [Streptomyces sp. AC602_WCS936]
MADSAFPYAKLSDLAEVTGGVPLGRTIPEAAGVELPYLRVANVQDGYISTSELKTVRVLRSEVPRYSVLKGDVLLTEGGDFDKLGRGAVWDGRISPCLHQNHLFRVRCNTAKLLPEYLAIYLASGEGRRYFLSIAKQTTNLATINSSQLRKMPIPRPRLDEQRRIIEVLHSINEGIAVEHGIMSKQALIQEGLLADQLERHAEEYPARRLMEVSKGPGEYGSNAAAVERSDELPRYVRITDIDDKGSLSSEFSSMVSVPWAGARKYLLAKGDLLIARTGFTTGKSYLYQASDGLCAFAGYLVRFRIDPSLMLPEYAFLWTRGGRFKRWVSRNVREVGQRNISASEYNAHELPVPPLQEQERLVRLGQALSEEFTARDQYASQLKGLRRAVLRDLTTGFAHVSL